MKIQWIDFFINNYLNSEPASLTFNKDNNPSDIDTSALIINNV